MSFEQRLVLALFGSAVLLAWGCFMQPNILTASDGKAIGLGISSGLCFLAAAHVLRKN
jgi:hypothetical protein